MSVHEYKTTKGPRYYFTFDPPRERGERRDPVKRGGFIDRHTAELAEEKARARFVKLFNARKQGRNAVRGTVARELSEYVDLRMESIEITSWASMTYRLNTYIIPHIGHLTIHKASEPKVLLDFYHTLITKGGVKGEGVAKSLAGACYQLLISGLKGAGLDMSDAPKIRGLRRNYNGRQKATYGHHGTWDADQVKQFLTFTKGARLHAAWVLLFVTGMRRGELTGLRWEDINFKRKELYIRNQRTQVAWGDTRVIDKDPKFLSYRTIPLSDTVIAALQEHKKIMDSEVERREREAKRRKYAVKHHEEMGKYVFCSWRTGGPLNPSSLGEQLRIAIRKTDLPPIALHDGRHSVATIGHDAGVGFKSMQALLGHQHPATLLGIYTHHQDKSLAASIETMGDAVIPETEPDDKV